MARIDELLGQVDDDGLRGQLSAALRDLRRKKTFGLVFEEHIPETVLLPGAGVHLGSQVMLRRQPADKTRYVVQSLQGRRAVVADDGAQKDVDVSELLVLKPFGDPVYPILRMTDCLTRDARKPYHALINGENFHALELLLFGCESKVDCIYIDPPYNTGARDWKYCNDYVDLQDGWRHSKWLSFMEKRLKLAKRLLKPDGVLIVTIDEHEVHHLGILLAQVFPEYLRHMVSIVTNPKGTGKTNFARVDEYAFFVIPNTGDSLVDVPVAGTAVQPAEVDEAEEENSWNEDGEGEEADQAEASSEELPFPSSEQHLWEKRHARRRGGESSYRSQRPHQFYPLLIDDKTLRVVAAGQSLPLGQSPDFARVDGLKPIWPIDREGNERCWRYTPESMQKLIDGGFVVVGKRNETQDTYTINYWVRKSTHRRPKTVWWDKSHDAGTHGTTMLHRLLGRRQAFSFPKSLYAVRDTLALVVGQRPNALIVDFFAGSGTTLHAVALLNQADGGRRRTILVTNNEVDERQARQLEGRGYFRGDAEYEQHGIAQAVTAPRIRAALLGRRSDGRPVPGRYIDGRPCSEGFEENAVFLDLDYQDPDALESGAHFVDVLPALWLTAGADGQLDMSKPRGSWLIPDASHFAVLLDEDRLTAFLSALARRPDVTHVWLVTDSESAFARMRRRLSERMTVGMLYRDYLRSFRINCEVAR